MRRISIFFVFFITACESAPVSTQSIAPQSASYALAQIPKSTLTPQPTITPSPSPQPTVTLTPEPMSAFAEVIADTPAPEFFSPVLDEEAASVSEPVSYGGSKYILVDISQQYMYVYEGDVIVYSFVASTGMNNATRAGSFSVLNKIPNAYGSTWDIWMPSWLGIYWAGGLQNGIHALPILPNGAQLWAGYLGTPISYGCVVLGAYEAQVLYNWVDVGTPVEIQW